MKNATTNKKAEAAKTGDMSAALSVASFKPTHVCNMVVWGVGSKNDSLVRMIAPGEKVSMVEDDKGNSFYSNNEFITPIEKHQVLCGKAHIEPFVEEAAKPIAEKAFNPTHIYAPVSHGDKEWFAKRRNTPVEIVKRGESGFSPAYVSVRFSDGFRYNATMENLKPITEEAQAISRKGKMSSDRIHLKFINVHWRSEEVRACVKEALNIELPTTNATVIVRPSQFGRLVALMMKGGLDFEYIECLEPKLVADTGTVIDASRNPNTVVCDPA